MHPFAFIFDFDGTLADTKHLVLESLNQFTSLYNLPHINEIDEMEKIIRMYLLSLNFKLIGLRDVLKKQVFDVIENNADKILLQKGFFECIPVLHQAGIQLGILTNNRSTTVKRFLANYSLDKYFSFIISGDDKRAELKKILTDYGLASTNVFYVGDQVSDIKATAGIAKTVAVTWGFERDLALKRANPDYLISDVNEIIQLGIRKVNEENPLADEILSAEMPASLHRCLTGVNLLPKHIPLYDNAYTFLNRYLCAYLQKQKNKEKLDDDMTSFNLDQLSNAIYALLDLRTALENTKHKTLQLHDQGMQILNLRYGKINQLLIDDNFTHLEIEVRRIEESTSLIKKVDKLKEILDFSKTCTDSHPLFTTNKVYQTAEHFFQESGKSAVKQLLQPVLDFNQTQLLSETLRLISEGIRNPLVANLKDLEQKTRELQKKNDSFKSLAGAAFLMVSAFLALSATLFVLSSVVLRTPSFGISLFQIPASQCLYGTAAGFFTSGLALGGQKKLTAFVKRMTDSSSPSERMESKSLRT